MTSINGIPATLVAGDTWSWSDAEAFKSHPPELGWVVRYILRLVSGGAPMTIEGTSSDAAYIFEVAPSVSQAVTPGAFEWSALAFGTGDVRSFLCKGRLAVLPDPMAATGDSRSPNERTLDAINATLEGRATKDADAYTIEGRSITRTPLPDLLRLQAIYQRRVAAERSEAGSFLQMRKVRFS